MAILCSTSIGAGFDLETALDRVVETECPNIDLLTINGWAHVDTTALADDWDATVARVDGLVQTRNLTIKALNSGTGTKFDARGPEADKRRVEESKALVRFMRRHNLQTIAIQPPLKGEEKWSDAEQDDCMDSLEELLDFARSENVTFALELHSRSPFETEHQIKRLLDRIPEVPLVYDPTHFIMIGGQLRETKALMKNAAHVHIRDAAKGKIQAPFGEGEVDFDWVLGSLKDSGYTGHISMEYLGGKNAPFDVVDSSRRLYETIQKRFGE